MDNARVEAIFDELGRIGVDLPDKTRGISPSEIRECLIACRQAQDRIGDFEIEVQHERARLLAGIAACNALLAVQPDDPVADANRRGAREQLNILNCLNEAVKGSQANLSRTLGNLRTLLEVVKTEMKSDYETRRRVLCRDGREPEWLDQTAPGVPARREK